MIEQYAVATLYLVPVAVAALIAYFVTREPDEETPVAGTAPRSPRVPAVKAPLVISPRDPWHDLYESESLLRAAGAAGSTTASTAGPVPTHGTLLNAALSAHFDAVSRASDRRTGGRAIARPAASHLPLRSVSVRRPTRHSRRAAHRCYKQGK
jgi:hypothetical protein